MNTSNPMKPLSKPKARPALDSTLSASKFSAWYWLKAELQTYCRAQGLPMGGSKADLAQRVGAHLGGTLASIAVQGNLPKAKLPEALHLHTVIQPGWALSHGLRRFFVSQVGEAFRFNQPLRALFQNPQGQTLGQAVDLYLQIRHQRRPIGAQFQFNQHMRDYFAQHPDATRDQALRAWREKRETAGSLR